MFSYLKRLFYHSHLDFLNVGDIVWAKRYDTEEEKQKIEEGHRESPYVIIHKAGKKVYALEFGSNKSLKSIQLFKLAYKRKEGYHLTKDGYIYVGKLVLLNENRYIRKVGKLEKEDFNRIYKSIYLINQRYKKVKYFPKRKLKFYYEVGDIISYNGKMFYIYDMDDSFYYTNPVYQTKKGSMTINNITYSYDFMGTKKIEKKSKIKLLNITDEAIQQNIKELTEKKKRKIATNRTLTRGKLIAIQNAIYYYIYGEYKGELLVYRVYLDHEKNPNMYKIMIKKGVYYTLFEESMLQKTVSIKILREASELEMDAIKKMRKSIRTEKKQKNGKDIIYHKKYQPGLIILKKDTLDRYIILERNFNTIVYAPLEEVDKRIECTFFHPCAFDFTIMEKMDPFRFELLLKNYYSHE